MLIHSLQVKNYKSHRDTGPIDLCSGFNVVIGQNNSGKTALLEAISFGPLVEHPYVGVEQPRGHVLDPHCAVCLDLEIEVSEFRTHLLSQAQDIIVPAPTGALGAQAIEWFESLFASQKFCFNLVRRANGWSSPRYPSLERLSNPASTLIIRPAPDKQTFDFAGQRGSAQVGDENLYHLAATFLTQSVYVFRAERLNVGTSRAQSTMVLKPDASNLAAALWTLQGRNPAKFRRLEQNLRKVFPSLYGVSAAPSSINNDMVDIRLWSADQANEREDLAFNLSDCGTGVGQVLAILFVVLTFDTPRTIVIDEPNSFLHPGAVKKLISILKDNDQHQYIISTHSPDVIGSSDPATLHLIQWTPSGSNVKKIDRQEFGTTRLALLEVGAALSDVFGADAILWVEGPTEERCFPKIIERFKIDVPAGTTVLAVRNVGDLEGGRPSARSLWAIYNRLSGATALTPPAIAFSLDRETRNQTEMDDLKKESKGLVRFIPRRTYENYLLNPNAIAAMLNSELPTFQSNPLEYDCVSAWISEHGSEKKYFKNVTPIASNQPDWVCTVDAPKLLQALVSELSGAKEEYNKIRHSIALTDWILANAPDDLSGLADYLREIFDSKKSASSPAAS